ncbi:alpha/beta hydrolase [Candidatus Kaiserbacteria bacterium]|nr:alpha/beta hydrolase [Candidatus Kaiserbacteria bacterium]
MTESIFEKRGICYRTNEFQIGRPTLVFIHGLSGSASAWFLYENVFESAYNVLTFDLRGHGKSTKFKRYEEYVLQSSADDVYELLNYLKIEKYILISHSYGTLVALELLNVHQEKVSKIIFLSPTAFLSQTKWFWVVKIIGTVFITLFKIIPFHPVVRERVDYTPFKNTGDWNLRRLFKDIRTTSVRVYLYCLVQAYTKNYDELWATISVPTMIMHGTEDSIIPVQHTIQLAKEISGSKLVLLERANHIIVLNNMNKVVEHIESFLV